MQKLDAVLAVVSIESFHTDTECHVEDTNNY